MLKAAGCFFTPAAFPLFVLALASCLGLFLSLNRRFLIVLSFSNLLDDSVPGGLSLKTLECALERFVFLNSNLAHKYSLPPLHLQGANFIACSLLYNKQKLLSTAFGFILSFYLSERLNNEIYELAGNIEFLYERHSVGKLFDLFEFLGRCNRTLRVDIGGYGKSVTHLAVDLNGYLNLIVNSLALVIFRPCGKRAKPFAADLLPNLLTEMRSERAEQSHKS